MSRDPDSNVTIESESQSEKQKLQRILTEAGIQIDVSEEHDEKALSPISWRIEPDSKFTS
jgi:hypothetical protein